MSPGKNHKQKSCHHRSKPDRERSRSYGPPQSSNSEEEEEEKELVCCIHGKPCELKGKQTKAATKVTVLSNAVSPIQCHPSTPSSINLGARNPTRKDSAEETGYENLQILNEQSASTSSAPTPTSASSSASSSSDDNQFNYEPISDDLKASYEPISRGPVTEKPTNDHMCPMPVVATNHISKPFEDLHKTMYLGEMSRTMAEAACLKPASFLLYHRHPTGHSKLNKYMPPALPLFIVYHTSRGEYFHYRVVGKEIEGSRSPNFGRRRHHKEYRVDISGEPYFSSLKSLVCYYLTYVMVGKDGATDIFPWWNTQDEGGLNHADIYYQSK